MEMCEACGSDTRLLNVGEGFMCQDCEIVYWTGPEESSFIRSNILSRRFPLPMSDPWDMVKP